MMISFSKLMSSRLAERLHAPAFIGVICRLRIIANASQRCVGTTAPPEGVDVGEWSAADPQDETKLEEGRDISKLNESHRNIMHGVKPFSEPKYPHHFSERYQKRIFARYGSASQVDPTVCWPNKEELEDRKEWERVTYPYTIPQIMESEAEKLAMQEKRLWERDEQVAKNIIEMDKMKAALRLKEEEAARLKQDAQERKQRLIAEVKEHFNYSMNERDDRFREELFARSQMLKEKERLTKKAEKTEKNLEKRAAALEAAKRKILEEEAKASIQN